MSSNDNNMGNDDCVKPLAFEALSKCHDQMTTQINDSARVRAYNRILLQYDRASCMMNLFTTVICWR